MRYISIMVAKKVLFFIGLYVFLLGRDIIATSGPEVCNFQRLTTSQPAQQYNFEGGSVELWDVKDEQFQCIGAFPSRITVKPGSLQLPAFHHFPLLVLLEQGEGVMGIHLPGYCGYQKEFRVKRGDVIAIPAGAVHWSYNNGNQDSVAIIINHLKTPSNQLDMLPRTFHLSGGVFRKQQVEERYYVGNNILNGFDTALLAEAFNSNPQTVRAMQLSDPKRGFIVRLHGPIPMPIFHKEEEEDDDDEINICTSKTFNTVNDHKLPLLSNLDLSAEKGHLQQNALFSPQWSTNSHTMMYVLNGDAQIETVSNNGRTVFDKKVSKGDIFLVPQMFVSTARAGENGFEWVAFKTNKSPMKTLVTSAFRAMPLDVITNAYQLLPNQAQNLKTNRETENILFSPQTAHEN